MNAEGKKTEFVRGLSGHPRPTMKLGQAAKPNGAPINADER